MQGQGEIVVLTPLFRSVIITILFALALVFYVSSDISFGQLFTPLPLLLVAIPLAAAHLALSRLRSSRNAVRCHDLIFLGRAKSGGLPASDSQSKGFHSAV